MHSTEAQACSRPINYKDPSFEENFKAAQLIVSGLVEKKTEVGPEHATTKYELDINIEKTWKGKAAKKLKAIAYSNTCNPFGQITAEKLFCIFLLSESNTIISQGESSKCVAVTESKKIISEFEIKLRGLTP